MYFQKYFALHVLIQDYNQLNLLPKIHFHCLQDAEIPIIDEHQFHADQFYQVE